MSDATTETDAEVPEVDPATVRQVWKFPIPFPCATVEEQVFRLTLPKGAKLLHVDLQGGKPFLWAAVKPGAETEERVFFVVGTGQDWPEPAEHVGTFQMAGVVGGPPTTVWHVFAVLGTIESLMRGFGGLGLF